MKKITELYLRAIIKKRLEEIINESSTFDKYFINKARNAYKTIVKNINTIQFVPTDKNDIVKDSRNRIHELKGVKFNLNQLNDNYDVMIYFANTIGRYQPPHFDGNNNRFVFFIITQVQDPTDFESNSELARLRFPKWVDENTFVHEFIHYLDTLRYSNTYKGKQPKNDSEYFNSPEEYNAYTMEIVNNALNNKKLFLLPFKQFVSKLLNKENSKEFINNLNDNYKRKLIIRLYKLYSEFNQKKI